jgi:dihydrofolate reductase
LVFPLMLGAGERLFPDADSPAKLVLAGTEAYENGVLHLTYGRAGPSR